MLHVDRVDSLQTEKVHIRADGLEVWKCYTMRLTMHESKGAYSSYCVVKSSSLGCIDLARDEPVRSSYHGVDPMGLFLTLRPTQSVRFGNLLTPTVTRPTYYTLQLFTDSGKLVDQIKLKKRWTHPLVTRIEVNDTEHGLYGVLFRPPGPGPFPCILDVPGARGGITEPTAACLASEGFLVFTFAYYLKNDLPKRIPDVDVKFFDAPIRFVRSLPHFSGRLGAYGLSFGGTIANFLAIRYPQIAAVVSVNSMEAFCEDEMVFRESGRLMTCGRGDEGLSEVSNEILRQEPGYRELYENLTDEERIQWKHAARETAFRIVGGLDDWVTCSTSSCVRIQKELLKNGNRVEIDLLPAGHSLEPPYSPHHAFVFNKFTRLYFGLGGECFLHSKSQETAWKRNVDFFRRHLGNPPTLPDWRRETEIVEQLPEDSDEHAQSKL